MGKDKDNFVLIENPGQIVPIKAWINGVALEDEARKQLLNVSKLPIIYKHIAVMPDVHWGMGATVGSVIPTVGAIIPAAVGVDIGCGMVAAQTTLTADDLPTDLREIRRAIEKAVPHGRTEGGGRGDRGAWHDIPKEQTRIWSSLKPGWDSIVEKHPKLNKGHVNHVSHLGTLGTGNHFVEVCLDTQNRVWFMLHSGSRGVGNRIGTYFVELAKQDMAKHISNLPDKDLAYFQEGSPHFDDYVEAVSWAQNFAKVNRELMMQAVIKAVQQCKGIPAFSVTSEVINCHHNYVQKEKHFGQEVLVTRKGAVRVEEGEYGIIPGSMGTRSYIVLGRGNPESFNSCSHGAGRAMSRNEAKKRFSINDHIKATEGIECRKDAEVIDETPAAYKSIDNVMRAQKDLVAIVHELRQIVVVKG
jgi:tRNA-splicing ligase RtcB (3'-phosphate/5'-hydroxy nucleic acid ligase)